MVDDSYKAKIKNLTKKHKEKIKSYSNFCETDEAEIYKLSEEEIEYYTSKQKEGD